MSTLDNNTSVRPSERRLDVMNVARAHAFSGLFFALIVLWASLISAGCQTTRKVDLPKVVAEDATTGELCAAINANSAKIKSIYAPNASIGVMNQPGWAKSQLFFDRPNKLRVVGTATLVGRVVDSGCDGDQFWFWSSFQNADELYYCKLDQYKGSSLAELVPIDPTWFPEALGIVEIKEEDVEGRTNAEGEILLTVKRQTPDGVYRKRVYVEPRTAAIRRQDVQNPQGETILSVIVREQQYVDAPGVVMPRRIEIRCEGASPSSDTLGLTTPTLLVDVGTPTLNDSSKMEASVFQRPTDVKATAVDLGASAAKNKQASVVPPSNFQPVRNAETAPLTAPPTPPTPPADVAKVAAIQPSLEPGPRPASSVAFNGSGAPNSAPANGTGIVSFPSSVASTPPPPMGTQSTPSPVVIQPTQTSGASVYAVTPAGGPQTLPTSDSAFAQRILSAQEVQNAQNAIMGVPARQDVNTTNINAPNVNATNFAAAQSAATNIAQTSNVPTTGYATQVPRSVPNVNNGAEFGAGAVANSPSVAPFPVQGGVDNFAPANQPSVAQPPVSSPSATTTAPVPAAAELNAAPVAPDDPLSPNDFPELLPF